MSNGTSSVAPSCPISHSQLPTNPRGTAPVRMPAIPIATDLPSLIRSVNIMRDILRSITTTLTVNNTYLPRQPRQPKVWGDRNYTVSPNPDWYQVEKENESGYVGKDPKARAYVERLHKIVFRNNERDDDNLFKWQYKKPLTGRGEGEVEPFKEDFFERVVRVKWKKEEPAQFYSVTWFWNLDVLSWGYGGGISQGCVPWDIVEPNTGGLLWAPDSGCSWNNFEFTKFGNDTRIVVTGQPTGSGEGSSNNHSLAQLGPEQYIIGESLSGTISAQLLSEAKCWGGTEYPPPPLSAFWSAFCRLMYIGYMNIGAITVNAGGISAIRVEDGLPLFKIRTEMSLNPSSYGGTVVVTFSDQDPNE